MHRDRTTFVSTVRSSEVADGVSTVAMLDVIDVAVAI